LGAFGIAPEILSSRSASDNELEFVTGTKSSNIKDTDAADDDDTDDDNDDLITTEWHSGDTVPRILNDVDGSGRSANGYFAGSQRLNTLRYYGLSDGAVVALTSRQMTMSSTTSTIYANSTNGRFPLPRTGSRYAGRLLQYSLTKGKTLSEVK